MTSFSLGNTNIWENGLTNILHSLMYEVIKFRMIAMYWTQEWKIENAPKGNRPKYQ
jgi:hypothetical protein